MTEMFLNLHFGILDHQKYQNEENILLQEDSCSPAEGLIEYSLLPHSLNQT